MEESRTYTGSAVREIAVGQEADADWWPPPVRDEGIGWQDARRAVIDRLFSAHENFALAMSGSRNPGWFTPTRVFCCGEKRCRTNSGGHSAAP